MIRSLRDRLHRQHRRDVIPLVTPHRLPRLFHRHGNAMPLEQPREHRRRRAAQRPQPAALIVTRRPTRLVGVSDRLVRMPVPVAGPFGQVFTMLTIPGHMGPSDADAEEVVVEEIVSIDESIAAIFEGLDLSEDFKSKVTLVFEAAVNEPILK